MLKQAWHISPVILGQTTARQTDEVFHASVISGNSPPQKQRWNSGRDTAPVRYTGQGWADREGMRERVSMREREYGWFAFFFVKCVV